MVMEFKGTPGKWFQSHRKTETGMYSTQVYTEDGKTICTLDWYPKPIEKQIREGKNVSVIGTYREENAKLIAVAPDLLKTLDYINNELTKFHKQDNYSLNTNYLLKISTEAIEKALK